MDIAAASIGMRLTQVQQSVQTSMLKKTMDSQEAQAQALIAEMMPPAQPAPLGGHIIDTYA